ncbi:MAG TPA: sulfatase-like hydrolase/transferase [Vicinamibacterales bacterium]|jgi:arylsulfatase A-like enzyme/tetratricopeptide (TPR) repeat protein|nr:sulfatase-like hydrolase/transferase [Vicinamibacterales bacterium]
MILLAAAAVAAAAGVYRAWPRHVVSHGTDFGTLPSGVDRGRLNLVVVTLDTTRADRIGAYGGENAGTPTFDQLADQGVLFGHATTAAPLTLPAHSTLFTGRFPPEHGVRDNGGYFLNASETTLAETMKARGYATGGFIAAYVLDSKWGINQGFDTYFDDFDLSKYKALSMGAIQRPANEVMDHALPWIEQHQSSPFFAWIHLYDAHAPYDPPAPFRERYQGDPYQGEISFADSQVGRLVQTLKDRGLFDRTVIVVIGDHGESLGDHGEQAHGFFIYESTTHVPMLIRAPFSSMQHRRVDDPVRSVDVMPTVLDLLAVPPPANVTMDGRSLTPLMTGATNDMGLEAYAEAVYPLHHFGWSDLRALRQGRYKLIAAPRPELYDLQDDPREERNIYSDRRSLGDRMITRLTEMEERFKSSAQTASQAVEVDPDAKARLAALGYVGSFVATVGDTQRSGLADPKDKVGIFNKIGRARELGQDENQVAAAMGMLLDVVKEDPKVIDVWFTLGNMSSRNGDDEAAVGYFKRALALKADDEEAVINLAHAYRKLGRDDDALVGFRRFLQLDPKNAQVHYEIAQILIDRGQTADARKELNAALAVEPTMAAARNALGVVALNEGNLDGAEREIRAALQMKPDVRLAHFNLALVAEKRGDPATAEREYQQEMKDHPNNYKAAFNLGRLYEALGRRADQEAAYRQAIEADPQFGEGYFYLAKLLLDEGQRFDEAITLAQKGLEVAPHSEYAALGHYVLADLYNRTGRRADAAAEAARGRQSEKGRRS